jgi:hypothetical protein
MSSRKLAIEGGKPLINPSISPFYSIGEREKAAVLKVMDSGPLSGFYGKRPACVFWWYAYQGV